MSNRVPRIVIAATHSGAGKTSVALALVQALARRGLRVQTFKVGPDFLDPTYLSIASGRPCYNLDGWMADRAYVIQLFERVSCDADFVVIEGVMGLFDGADPAASEGSTAEIARWLDAPVLLVVNAHGVSRSLAALVKGCCEFEPGVRIAGVVANHCGSGRHAAWLAETLKSASLPPLLGAVPRGAFPALPTRHLGLVTANGKNLSPAILNALADVLEKHAKIEEIARLSMGATGLGQYPDRCGNTLTKGTGLKQPRPVAPKHRVRLGIAYDDAFHFYYQDNLDALEAAGCKLIRFSPINDQALPAGLQGLYFGGGYPEEHAEALSANRPMLDAVRNFAAGGRPVYAECGGLMYLAEGLETREGKRFPLAGRLPVWTRMLPTRKALGYVEAALTADSLWGARGASVRGHEFHYSELIGDPTGSGQCQSVYTVKRRRSTEAVREGFQRGRTLASYVHAYFACRPEAVQSWVDNCEAAKEKAKGKRKKEKSQA